MKYDFTTLIDRVGSGSIAVDGPYKGIGFGPTPPKEGFSLIPMWVADMSFPVFPGITDAIKRRMEHPLFGYFLPSDKYYESIINWHEKRNDVKGLKREHINFDNSVLGGLLSAMSACAAPGDFVLVHRPAYIGFTNALSNAGYRIAYSDLKLDENNVWRMDYEDMERQIAEKHIHAVVFCSPHNPTGRVWEMGELEKAAEIFKKYDCTVICDEIWSDMILYGNKHIPLQAVNGDMRERTVALYAPSKTFSLAGIVGSYHIIYNDTLRDRVNACATKSHYNEMNILSMEALIGAYCRDGMEWTEELCQVLEHNVELFSNYLERYEISFAKPEGTYMMFLDCRKWCEKSGKSIEELIKAGNDVGVAWQDGRPFGGTHTIRVNLALPESMVRDAIARLERYVFV